VSIELRDAPLDEVLRYLADAGGFSLVLEPSLGRPVTVSLHRVEPFDALVTLAEESGLRVRYANGVAIVAP
jgi:type II secretory pathway component HofQ